MSVKSAKLNNENVTNPHARVTKVTIKKYLQKINIIKINCRHNSSENYKKQRGSLASFFSHEEAA